MGMLEHGLEVMSSIWVLFFIGAPMVGALISVPILALNYNKRRRGERHG